MNDKGCQKLKQFAEEGREQLNIEGRAFVTFPRELAEYVVAAIESFTSGNAKSMDNALGFAGRGRGRPKEPAKEWEIEAIRKFLWLRFNGETVADAVAIVGEDRAFLYRICADHMEEYVAAEARRIVEDLGR